MQTSSHCQGIQYLPVVLANRAFQYNVAVVAGQTYFIDPSVATGYVYKVNAGDPNFASVILPAIQSGLFTLSFSNNGILDTELLAGGSLFSFPTGGVSMFTVIGCVFDHRVGCCAGHFRPQNSVQVIPPGGTKWAIWGVTDKSSGGLAGKFLVS
jgi:hypothetical protein